METKTKIRFLEILNKISDNYNMTPADYNGLSVVLKEVYDMGVKERTGSHGLQVDFLSTKDELRHETSHLRLQDRARVSSNLFKALECLEQAQAAAGVPNLPYIATATTLKQQFEELIRAF